MDKVSENQYLMELDKVPCLMVAQKMYFDLNLRFIACYGSSTVNVIPIKADVTEADIQKYEIDHSTYEGIYTV